MVDERLGERRRLPLLLHLFLTSTHRWYLKISSAEQGEGHVSKQPEQTSRRHKFVDEKRQSQKMNIAPSTTTSATASPSDSTTANKSIKRWKTANTAAAYSHLHLNQSPSSSSSSTVYSRPSAAPSLGQYLNNNNHVNKKSHQGSGHKNHNHVGSKKTLSLSHNSTICRSWKESEFTLDIILGRGHFGTIFRAYCYPHSFIVAGATTSTATTTTDGSGINSNGLPRKLGISVSSTNANNHSTTTDNNMPNTVALKRFSKSRIADALQRGSRLNELLQREINIHSNLQHPCIISFLGHYEDPNHLTLVLEYAAFGDLYGYMALSEQQPEGMSLAKRIDTARTVMSQMTAAVAHLQQLRVAHRDIKSENVLLVEMTDPPSPPFFGATATSGTHRPMPVPTVLKLCDFGWAVSYQGFISGRLSTLCGTPEYVPPEMLGPNRFYRGEFVDPWALGVLAYELVVGDTPFYVANENENNYYYADGTTESTTTDGSSHDQQDEAMVTNNTTATSHRHKKKNTVDRIFDNIRNFRELEFPIMDDVEEDYIDLVQGFLQVEPMHRRLAGDCLNHAFFQKEACSGGGQKENIMEKYHDSITPTVSQRCELWNKQKMQFGIWPDSEQQEI